MKRFCPLLLIFALLLTGCRSQDAAVSREEIMAAYEAAGYQVSGRIYEEKLDYGQIAYIQADHPDGDYIYFYIFESEEAAEAYREKLYHPGVTGLFSTIFGKPSWLRWEVYGCIVVQYTDPDLFEPFRDLIDKKNT